MNTQDTICAIATAQGGAIGVIRISGKDAIAITDRIFTPVGKHPLPLSERKAYTMAFGHIRQDDGEIIDEVLIGLFSFLHGRRLCGNLMPWFVFHLATGHATAHPEGMQGGRSG